MQNQNCWLFKKNAFGEIKQGTNFLLLSPLKEVRDFLIAFSEKRRWQERLFLINGIHSNAMQYLV